MVEERGLNEVKQDKLSQQINKLLKSKREIIAFQIAKLIGWIFLIGIIFVAGFFAGVGMGCFK